VGPRAGLNVLEKKISVASVGNKISNHPSVSLVTLCTLASQLMYIVAHNSQLPCLMAAKRTSSCILPTHLDKCLEPLVVPKIELLDIILPEDGAKTCRRMKCNGICTIGAWKVGSKKTR
jgi:hypothetical protein